MKTKSNRQDRFCTAPFEVHFHRSILEETLLPGIILDELRWQVTEGDAYRVMHGVQFFVAGHNFTVTFDHIESVRKNGKVVWKERASAQDDTSVWPNKRIKVHCSHIPLTSIIPPGKKMLLANLKARGFETLENCALREHELRKVPRVGRRTFFTIKEHCFRRNMRWDTDVSEIRKLTEHFIDRHHLTRRDAAIVARVFFWENARASSFDNPLF